jgi:hypothetical protein
MPYVAFISYSHATDGKLAPQLQAAIATLQFNAKHGLAFGALVLGAYAERRIDVAVKSQLSAMDLGTDAKIVDMDKNIASNKALSERNKEEIDDAERRVEQAFEILMGRD